MEFPAVHGANITQQLDAFLSVIPIGDIADAEAEARAAQREVARSVAASAEEREEKCAAVPYAAVAPDDLEGYEREDENQYTHLGNAGEAKKTPRKICGGSTEQPELIVPRGESEEMNKRRTHMQRRTRA